MVIRPNSILLSVAVSCLAFGVHAGESCDPTFVQQYQGVVGIVNSLRLDKSGQMRVYAVDGSEFTAGQARWMQGQLRSVDEACARGDQATAIRLLDGVQQLVKEHKRVP